MDGEGKKVLIFGGTAEGRKLSEYLEEKKISHTVCVATEYGEEVLAHQGTYTQVHTGRLTDEAMEALMVENRYDAVVDATHPYAAAVSENVRRASQKARLPYLRYLRPGMTESGADSENRWFVESAQEAAELLERRQGRIFLTTGSKELHVFTEHISDKSRLFARVLPSAEVVEGCRKLGLEGKQICAMQGPFSEEMNVAMLRQTGAAFLVTKDTGDAGGFPEKERAAIRAGVKLVIIRRPEDHGMDWETLLARLDEVLETAGGDLSDSDGTVQSEGHPAPAEQKVAVPGTETAARVIHCIGIGMGDLSTMTLEARDCIRNADIVFGAGRMLDLARIVLEGTALPLIEEYRAAQIRSYLDEHSQYRTAAVLFSGDIGFYSGADGIRRAFGKEDVRYHCGISSIVYFASRIPTAWQDVKLLSAHGRSANLIGYVKRYPKVMALSGTAREVEAICEKLIRFGLEDVTVTVGSNLSYPQEQIKSGHPGQFLHCETQGLHILMIQNDHPKRCITPGIADSCFVRGKVPMTKEEIRALSVSKLRLTEDAVVCDVGAGTGSVSIECAHLCTDGMVYAVEKNPEGVDLIRENCLKFGTPNITIVEGLAPDALQELPAFTHAFIGGSSGHMQQIVETLLAKNPQIRIVINTIALESIAETMEMLKALSIEDADIVQISAAKSKTLGRYHMMQAHNPIYIVSFGGK